MADPQDIKVEIKEESAVGTPRSGKDEGGEAFYHPETGEKISKNAYKKLLKGGKKEKKEKVAPKPADPAAKKEKKEKKAKEPEQIYTDSTPPGEFKKINDFFPATYQPQYVEAAWYAWWEKKQFFQPNVELGLAAEQDDKFIMVIPPPNVTGSLHLGHGLTAAIEDTLTRWNRMRGKVTLWVPGVDHAGIATQSVVERKIKKEEGLTRHDLGREEFVKKVWKWKEMYGDKITSQIRFLGNSVDWSREAFTMNSNLSRAVTEAFVRFHEDGLLYRDTRLINWSCALQSAISEIEVDYIDLEDRTFLAVPNHTKKPKYEFGMITSFAYKVVDSDEEIVVATTRLETMLGDTAVAVHPEDPRYKHLHGKFLQHPFLDRRIPIVLDGELVDMSFGTGAVKITPAHDPNDYQCGKRNNLEFIIMITDDGKIAPNGGKFAGMMRYDARIAIEEELTALGLYKGKAVNKMRLGLCSRSGDIIEPMLTPQWYVNCSSMAQRSVDAVRSGELKILPAMHEGTWFMWLENIRDWCVSRQLWWGHRIPAYFARLPGEDEKTKDQNDPANGDRWFVARTIETARANAAKALNVSESDISLTQDPDVLDTWFSSGLFPFSVYGWPEETNDFKAFFPTTLLETGLDILFFWVARMVMMSLHLTDKLPFTTVYLHAMVRDKYGRKMSKSLGNVIDPLEVIRGCALSDLLSKIEQGNLPEKEIIKAKQAQSADFPDGIPECGADALRFGLLAYTVQGRDVNLDIKRVVGYRQFCNKIWNAFRFSMNYLNEFLPYTGMHSHIIYSIKVTTRDSYILSRLNSTIKECTSSLETYQFANATTALHSFFLYDVCDFYLEVLKPVLSDTTLEFDRMRVAQATLYTVLEQFLRLLHPIMPFVTEELWQRLPLREHMTETESIMTAKYPKEIEEWENPKAEKDIELIKDVIHGARSLRSDYKVPNHMKADFYFVTENTDMKATLEKLSLEFCTLAKGNFLTGLETGVEAPKGCCVKVLNDQLSLLVDLTGLIDLDTEIARLGKEIERLTPMVDTYMRKTTVPDYETKVPENVRTTNAEKLQSYQAELEATNEALKSFLAMKG